MSDQEPEAEVATLLRHQTTLARFGELALRSEDLNEILTESCRLVGEALRTDLAKVLELQDDGCTLLVRAGVGWKPGVVGHTRIEAEEGSSEGHALQTGEPVISVDITQETRFTIPAFLHENGVRALVNVVIIGGKDQPPYGVLQVDSRSPREFDEDDISFLRTYANLLAAAVDRLRVLGETRRAAAFVRASSEALYSMSPDWREMRELTGSGFLAPTTKPNPDWLNDYIHPDDQATVTAAIAEAIRTKSQFQFEHRVRLADGSLGWTSSRAVPLLDPAGAITEWFGAASDITERVRAEQLADRITNRLEGALRLAKLGTYEWYTATGIVELDARSREIFGLPLTGEIADGAVFGRVAADDVDRVRAEAMTALRSQDRAGSEGLGRTVDITYDIVLPDGSRRSVASSGTVLSNDDGSRRMLGSFNDVTALKRAEAVLRQENEALGQQVEESLQERDRIWQLSHDMLGVADPDGVWLSINPAWTTILGWSEAEIVGRKTSWLQHPDDLDSTQEARDKLKAGEALYGFENRLRTRGGSYRMIHWTAIPYEGRTYGVGRDVTAEREQAEALGRTEEALRQAQKMEAVGQLTGGLAHDFNNLLAGMMGNLELLQRRIARGRLDDLGRLINAAQGAGQRAAALTQRLLAFLRRQTLDPKPTDVNRLIAGMDDMLRRTVGATADIEIVGAPGLWTVNIDAGQLENAMLNLCINGRDAMSEGGKLTIETANKWLDDRAAQEHNLSAGQYISLCVTDTGTGMSVETIKRVFEPFYTTKPLGQGTGLGLSMIYGFAQQSGGQVHIQSELGRGTTVCILLPRHDGEAANEEELEAGTLTQSTRAQTVLVVDDEATIRHLIDEVLNDLGYTVINAADGAAGIKVLQSGARIELLITDVGLPGGMNGRQLADAGRVLRPDLKVLFITGFAENAAVGNGNLEAGMELLTKPFTLKALTSKVADMLRNSLA